MVDHIGVQEVVAINRGSFAMWTAREDSNLADGVKMALFFNDQQCGMRVNRYGAKKAENVAKNNRSSRYQGVEREDSFPKEPNFDLTLDKNQCGVTFEGTNSPRMVDNSFMVIPNREKVIAGIP